ncbi:putative kinesin, partial [Trypanosoma grayi]|uniref:putative kinesin n=1 Tax=Trypanosoma grayi TaxID=71804 RepID=UPI0004F41AFB
MTEKVRVVARIRPLPSSDSALAVVPLDERRVCVGNRRVYHVDRVFGIADSTELIFYESVVGLVDRFLAGYNATVLAYGPTGTGKTYTMAGLTPLVLAYLLERMGGMSRLSFQCIEVYGETLRDLLTGDPPASAKHLQLHEGDG